MSNKSKHTKKKAAATEENKNAGNLAEQQTGENGGEASKDSSGLTADNRPPSSTVNNGKETTETFHFGRITVGCCTVPILLQQGNRNCFRRKKS